MARRLIGLDVGTNAVRVVELEATDPPRVTAFGQIALPFDAMREGEVVDGDAVSAAIQRLWRELALRRGAEVRLGVASPRVLVRTIDLPSMPEADLAGALRFQAQELIPIPLDEAVLDFQVIETLAPPLGEEPAEGAPPPQPMSRVLLAAAHRDTVDRLVSTVHHAGLRVAGVDLVPLGMLRTLGRGTSDESGAPGAEAIISVGGGVNVVVVHEDGLPRFVRILGGGGRVLTDAIVRELDLPVEQAESLKRQGDQAPGDLAARARGAMRRPLTDLVEQIRSSLDYYRSQPGAARLQRVELTGGGSLTPGLADQLRDLVGLPVAPAAPREVLDVGDIGFPAEQLPALDPFLPVPAGLALGGLGVGRRIDLAGTDIRTGTDLRKVALAGALAAAALAVALGALTLSRQHRLDQEKSKLAAVQAANGRLQSKASSLQHVQQAQTQVDQLRNQVETLLQGDVSWARLLQDIGRTIPNDTWLTAFQATSSGANRPATGASPAPATPSTGTTPTTAPASGAAGGAAPGAGASGAAAPAQVGGTVSFTVVGLDFTSVASWMQRVSRIPSFTNLWVPSATHTPASGTTPSIVNFTSNATITPAARSDRLEQLRKAVGG